MTINVFGTFSAASGLGNHLTQFCQALATLVPLRLYPNSTEDLSHLSPTLLQAVALPESADPNDPSFTMGYGPGLSQFPGHPQLGYTMFDYTRIPDDWMRSYLACDALITASNWGRDVLIQQGYPADKVFVVPAGVDPTMLYPNPRLPDATAPFRFLSVGKWERRKSFLELISAFITEFGDRPDVELVLRCAFFNMTRADIAAQLMEFNINLPENVKFISHISDLNTYRALFQSSHVFVLPTKCEGWGLPILEAMACGVPVITTLYGGQSAFCSSENVMALQGCGTTPVNDPQWYDPAIDWGKWLQIDITELGETLRYAFTSWTILRQQALGQADQIRHQWSWENAARVFMTCGGGRWI